MEITRKRIRERENHCSLLCNHETQSALGSSRPSKGACGSDISTAGYDQCHLGTTGHTGRLSGGPEATSTELIINGFRSSTTEHSFQIKFSLDVFDQRNYSITQSKDSHKPLIRRKTKCLDTKIILHATTS